MIFKIEVFAGVTAKTVRENCFEMQCSGSTALTQLCIS